jgi:hypothetical protein
VGQGFWPQDYSGQQVGIPMMLGLTKRIVGIDFAENSFCGYQIG